MQVLRVVHLCPRTHFVQCPPAPPTRGGYAGESALAAPDLFARYLLHASMTGPHAFTSQA
jgi:hypothetical protein